MSLIGWICQSALLTLLFLDPLLNSAVEGACPIGSWGPTCSGTCHCASGDTVCSTVDGRCTAGGCGRGYTGTPYCQTECPSGTYGLHCSYTCHCPVGDDCNHINGICSSDHCLSGWTGTGCSLRLPVFSSPPNITSTSFSAINVSWRKWTPSLDPGVPPVAEYHLQCRETTSVTWLTHEVITVSGSQAEPDTYQRTVADLTAKAGYVFRLALARDDEGKVGTPFAGPETSIVMACSAPTQPVANVLANQELQQDGLAMIAISWTAPTSSTSGCNSLSGYKVILECSSNLCQKQEAIIPHPQHTYTFRDIRPDVTKDITIYPVNDAGTLGPATFLFAAALNAGSSSTSENTASSTADGSVSIASPDLSIGTDTGLQIRSRSEDSLELTWQHTGSEKYTITATVIDSYSLQEVINQVQQMITVSGDSITLHNLHTASQYAITVASNDNVLYQRSFWTQPSQPPTPPNPTLKLISDKTVTMYIEPLSIDTGPLTSYRIVVEELIGIPVYSRQKRFANVNDTSNNTALTPVVLSERLSSSIDFDNLTDYQEAQVKNLNHYITASLSSTQVDDGLDIIVGDGLNYGGFYNAPLKPSTYYKLWIGIVSRLDGINKQTFSNVDGGESSEYTIVTRHVGYDLIPLNTDSNRVTLIVGITLFCLMLIIGGILVYLLWRRHWILPSKLTKLKASGQRMFHFIIDRYYSNKDSILEEKVKVEAPRLESGDMDRQFFTYTNDQQFLTDRNKIRVEEFPAYYYQSVKITHSLGDEFQQLCAKSSETSEHSSTYVGSLAQNAHLNRSAKALPFDENRVCLNSDIQGANDYINASVLDELASGKCIVTQSPLPLTIPHFWRAIWEKKVSHIVMLLASEELSKSMPEYWPQEGKDRMEGHLSVRLVEEESYAYYTVRSFELCHKMDNEIRYVRHFQYRHWKPSGVPVNTIGFLDFMRRCHRNSDPNDNFLVHCQCGTGRSGLFLAIKILADQAVKSSFIDIQSCVLELHDNRKYLVKNVSQYKFIHEAMAEIAGHRESAISTMEIAPYYYNLTHVIEGNKLKLLREFERMMKQSQSLNSSTARFLSPARANLYGSLVTSIKSLPQLRSVFVDSYKQLDRVLLVTYPSQIYLSDFWSLLMETGCHTIIRILDKDESTHPFIPEHPESHTYGTYTVTNQGNREIVSGLHEHRLIVQDKRQELNEAPEEIQLVDIRWPQWNVGPKTQTMSQLGSYIQFRCNHNPGKIMVVERAGSGNGGLLCLSLYLLEMLDTQGEVDVFRATKHLRSQVPDTVTIEDQYRYCYKVVKDHVKGMMYSPEKSHSVLQQDDIQPPWKSPYPVHTSTPKVDHMGDANTLSDNDSEDPYDDHPDTPSQGQINNSTSDLTTTDQKTSASSSRTQECKKAPLRLSVSPQLNSFNPLHSDTIEASETTLSPRERDWKGVLRAASRLRRMTGGQTRESFPVEDTENVSLGVSDLSSGKMKQAKGEDTPKCRSKEAGIRAHRLDLEHTTFNECNSPSQKRN